MKKLSIVERVNTLVGQLQELLAWGGFHLTKWCSKGNSVSNHPDGEKVSGICFTFT